MGLRARWSLTEAVCDLGEDIGSKAVCVVVACGGCSFNCRFCGIEVLIFCGIVFEFG